MRPGAQLAGFAAATAVVAGIAAAIGLAVGPLDSGSHTDGHGGEAHGGAATMDPHAAPPGLASTADGLSLVPEARTAATGDRADYAFRIVDEAGATVRDFDVEHAKRMHMIVVRRDLTGFQHVHPRMDADGTWRVPLRLDAPGTYRVFADFARDGESSTLGVDLTVPGAADHVPLPTPAPIAQVDGYSVGLDSEGARAGADGELGFTVGHDGEPVADVQPYLGARGHLVALREGDLAFLHVHPLDDATAGADVRFRVEWPSAGRYRLFLQVKHDGRIVTAPFTVEVDR